MLHHRQLRLLLLRSSLAERVGLAVSVGKPDRVGLAESVIEKDDERVRAARMQRLSL